MKRMMRLVPVGLGATFLLFTLARWATNPHDLFPDEPPFFPHGPPPHPPHPFGADRPLPPPYPHTAPSTKWSIRAEAVRDAFKHAYGGYVKYAGEHDELLPVTGAAVDK